MRGRRPFKPLIIFIVSLLGASTMLAPVVRADQYDQQIQSLNQQNAQNRAAVGSLESQEESLAGNVAALQAKIAALEQNIHDNQAKSEQLKQDIAKAEAEIAYQREVLGENIKQMYLDDDVSTLEKVAASRDLSDYFDKEQYRVAVQGKIKTTLARINELKVQLEQQRATVEKLLADQQEMQQQLAVERAEAQRLLSLNQSQQADFENGIKSNNTRIAELRRQQAIENAKHFKGGWQTGGTGSYPWANAPFPNSISDPWGMYLRQCVSYTAWKVANSGRHMPFWGGRGNANQWDDNARKAGIPVDTSPRVGDVAVSNAGTYGHVMYVEAVHGNGTITISQYNAGWDGRYSVGTRSITGLVFIHF